MTEHRAAVLADLPDGKPHEVTLGDTKVVLVRQGDAVHALAGLCPHKGVPLAKGLVEGGRIVCAAHRAAFDLATGALLAPPACEGLARYKVRLADGAVHVTVPDDDVPHPVPAMTGRGDDARHFVIVGNGGAGWRAAEMLRREGFAGRLTVVAGETTTPYDRTDLSKAYLKADETPDDPVLRDRDAIAAAGIEILDARAQSLDPETRTLTLADGMTLAADALLLATGSDARTLDVPGADLEGVHTLRTLADAKAFRAALDGARHVVVIGAGFIGLEAAAALSQREGFEVTVIATEDLPLAGKFGDAFGRRILAEHEAAGVRVVTGAKVTGLGGAGRVSEVRVEGMDPVPADLVLVAVGASPRTGWLPFETGDDGGIAVEPGLGVPGAPGVFAAGDIARVPTPWGPVRIEHWRFAQETGELAARNMLGQGHVYDGTPFFWTMQQAKGSYTYTGHAEAWDAIAGAPDGETFRMDFRRDDRTDAVLALGFDDGVTGMVPRMAGRGPG